MEWPVVEQWAVHIWLLPSQEHTVFCHVNLINLPYQFQQDRKEEENVEFLGGEVKPWPYASTFDLAPQASSRDFFFFFFLANSHPHEHN